MSTVVNLNMINLDTRMLILLRYMPRYKNYICYICMQHILCNKQIHKLYVFSGHLALLVNHVIQKGTYVIAMYIGFVKNRYVFTGHLAALFYVPYIYLLILKLS